MPHYIIYRVYRDQSEGCRRWQLKETTIGEEWIFQEQKYIDGNDTYPK